MACAPPDPPATELDVSIAEIVRAQRLVVAHRGRKIELRPDADGIRATVLLCTHQGCAIQWDGDGYACVCHGGYFTAAGEPVRGPPKRPLRRLAVRTEAGRAYVHVGP